MLACPHRNQAPDIQFVLSKPSNKWPSFQPFPNSNETLFSLSIHFPHHKRRPSWLQTRIQPQPRAFNSARLTGPGPGCIKQSSDKCTRKYCFKTMLIVLKQYLCVLLSYDCFMQPGPAPQICVHMENFHPNSPGPRLAQGGISPSQAGPLPIWTQSLF